MPSVLIKSVISVLLFALVLCFQNCSGAFDVEGGSQSSIDGSFQLGNWNDAFPAGVKTSNCLDDPTYNICLSYKNPIVANKGLSFSPPLTPATSTRATEVIIFNYGLVVPLTGTLRNQHFAISDPVKPTANGTTGWKLAYKDDNNHFMPQLQAFYWANRQLTYMKERTGTFYYSNRIAPIKAFDPGANDNAYFDGIGVSLGYRVASQGYLDVGLDASVLAHEVGHGNLYVASRSAGVDGCTASGCFCSSKDGCFGAIHEGQGDVHAFILFPDSSVIGEHFINHRDGLRSAAQIRSDNVSAQELFDRRSGEVHDMGEAYSSIWWEVWSQYKLHGKERLIETIFTNHLAGLGTSDNFTTALDVIRTMNQQISEGDAPGIESAFDAEYTRMGIAKP